MSVQPDQFDPGDPENRSRNSITGEIWANYSRWLLKALRSPGAIVMDLIQPILFLVLFVVVFGGIAEGPISGALQTELTYLTFLLPAIVIQVAITTGQGAGITLVLDIEQWIFEKVMVSPMSTTAVFLGKTASELTRIAVQILIVLGLGLLMGATIETGILGMIGVVGIGMLFSIIFISLTTAIAMYTQDQEVMMSITMPVMFPLLFLSNAFLPLAVLPDWIRPIASVNPVTYGVDAARALIIGEDVMTILEVTAFGGIWNTLVPALLVLTGYIVVTGALAIFAIRNATSAEVS